MGLINFKKIVTLTGLSLSSRREFLILEEIDTQPSHPSCH